MTGAEFREAIHRLGLDVKGGCALLGISRRTFYVYADGAPPVVVARLLAVMLRHGLSAADVETIDG